jgi:hypothetical protein
MLDGEIVPTVATVYVEWDDIPGARTAAHRTHPVPESALKPGS